MEKSYLTIKGEIDAQGHKMDAQVLRGQKERIKDSEMEIRGLIRDLLVSGESGNLVEKGMTLERLMKDLKLQEKCLCRTMEEAQPYKLSEVTSMSGIQLPRIEVPTLMETP